MEKQQVGYDDVSLVHTLSCGQCFRWKEAGPGIWSGIVGSSAYSLAEADTVPGGSIYTDSRLSHYFDLQHSYKHIIAELSSLHPVLSKAVASAPGLRVLRQDPFETLISFIISQNNNIPRISGIIERISTAWGKPLENAGGRCAFPSALELLAADEKALRALGAGFRAPYIMDAVALVASGTLDLQEVAFMPLPEARQALQQVRGVGPKVAECVLLYGLGRLDAFPLDVWMNRAMAELFPGLTPSFFGPYAGIAQQYIFHYMRNLDLGRGGSHA